MALDKMVDSTKLDNALTATADAIREKGGGAIGSGSGAIVTVTDAVAGPAASLTTAINLVQDLHGYDVPWPAGGGTNKFDKDHTVNSTHTSSIATALSTYISTGQYATGYTTNATSITANTEYCTTFTPCISGTTYTVKNLTSGSNLALIGFVDDSGTVISHNSAWSNQAWTHTADSTEKYIIICAKVAELGNVMIVEGSTMPSTWTPYSNICPISGWTGANIRRTGANIWGGDVLAEAFRGCSGYAKDTTTKTITFNRAPTSPYHMTLCAVPFKPLTRYTLLAQYSNGGQNTSILVEYTDGTSAQISFDNSSNVKTSRAFVTASGKTVKEFYLGYKSTSKTTIYYEESGVFEGVLTYNDFEAYSGTTYTVQFGTAGTVYGGTLDVTTGELTVDRAKTTVSAMSWSYYNTVVYSSTIAVKANTTGEESNVISDTYLTAISTTGTGSAGTWADNSIRQKSDGSVIYIKDTRYTSASAFKTAMGSVEIVYELPTPQTYTLTPTEVQMLLGTNNVWSDTGNTTLKYPIDSELIPFDLENETGFADAIGSISTGVDISDTTAAASDVLLGKYFYTANGTKTQGSITTLGATTYTPGTINQTIASGQYLTGTQTILGDSNLVAGNIKEGTSIFGITGTHVGGPTNSDAVLTVTVTHGSSVIAEKGTSTLSPVIWTTSENSALDNAIFIIKPSMFDSTAWTITATLSGDTISDTITINSNLQYTLDLVRLYLYKDGEEYTSYTGGWSKIPVNGTTVTKNDNNIYMKAYSNGTNPAVVQTENPLDCTRYSTLHFIVTDTNSPDSTLGLVSVKGSYADSDFVALETIGNVGANYHVIVSISNLTGSYYPTVKTKDYYADRFYIYRVWAE